MANEWYIDTGGGAEGPVSEDELRARAAGGRLRPADRVSADGATWLAADTVPGLTFPPRRPLVETVAALNQLTDSSPPAEGFAPLEAVPGYELQGALGTGACGVVYRAVQTKLDRVVALKTVLMARNTTADVLARFDQEAVSLARLQHPNIVAVYDCGHTDGRAYFAMELLDGEDLGKRLDRDGPLDERTAWLIARQTAAALDHAARHGVIHRDVKPANLFLVPPPTGFPLPPGVPMVKVTDFGLAFTHRERGAADAAQTPAGLILGTPVYMAPEQFRGEPVDPRADVYSLGTTVHHALTGRLPFDGRTVLDVMGKKGEPPPRLAAPVSDATAELVAVMMATDAADRPADYADLIARIDALPCLDGAFSYAGLPAVAPAARPAPPVRRAASPRRKLYAALALAALAAGAVALVVANRPGQPSEYTAGANRPLFDGKSALGWQGQGWTVVQDEEKARVLEGQGEVTHALQPLPDFRVTLRLDLHRAEAVEVVLAVGDGPPNAAPRWVVRADRQSGATFGKRASAGAEFEPLHPAVPLPARTDAKTPYLQVRYERAGGALAAWLGDQPLGRTAARDTKATDLRLNAVGGPIRIEAAYQTELIEQE